MTPQPTTLFTLTIVLVPDDRGTHLRAVVRDDRAATKRSRTLSTLDGCSASSDLSSLMHHISDVLLDAFSTAPPALAAP